MCIRDRYWNEHVQRKVRDRLEFGRFTPGKLTREQYVIKEIAKVKYLRPELSEAELVHKLSYHFDVNIRTAILTQGINTLEALLNMLTQWEDVMPSAKVQYTSDTPKPSYKSDTAFNKDKTSGGDKNKFTEKPKRIQSINEVKNIEHNNKYSPTVSEAVDADQKNV